MSAHVLCFDGEATILDSLFRIIHTYHEEWTMAFVSSVDEGRISIRLSLTPFFARYGRFAACSACCPVLWTRRRGGML